ncbi:acyltransferase family protein [Sulfuricystis multivorans]|uniref:acyltransferase family protein n=1 Tax=Sulfuricystis multivorans TaxID=2211108 RepID=UPI000F83A94C|nr:acyltransferase family protein [Sulfuricystis multivorans]
MGVISSQTSFNFAVAKVLSILLVVGGHFFEGSLLWVPVTIGLFVFAFSSAYFTTKKYGYHFSYKSFWLNKLRRLVIPFWIAQGFLLLFFLVNDRDGIWTWQTVVHLLGMSGWINWLGFSNDSPFGAGLWFLTLLLTFYLLYPFLYRWLNQPRQATVLITSFLFLTLFLSYAVNVGHALWITAFAFWFGVYSARYPLEGSARLWLLITSVNVFVILILNAVGFKHANIVFIFLISISIVIWLERGQVSRTYFSWATIFYSSILEIYLIHTYLFINFGTFAVLRFLASLILIFVVANVLSRLGNIVTHWELKSL